MTRSAIALVATASLLATGCGKKTTKATTAAAEPVAAAAQTTARTPSPLPVPTLAPAPAEPSRPNTNFVSGGGAVQNVRQAARRSVALNDMHQLGQLIAATELETNRMPTKDQIREMLKRDAQNIFRLVEDGSIVLTGTRERGGLWAYEVDADTRGGIGVVGGTAQRMAPDEIKPLIGK